MLTTARDLVGRALHHLGVLAVDDTPSATEANQGLASLNALLSTLSLDPALLLQASSDAVTLTATQSSLTIGAGGTVDTTPVLKILGALIRDNNFDTPLRLLNDAQYNAIANKSLTGKPSALNAAFSGALCVVTLWPAPDKTYTLIISSQKKLTSFTSLTDTVLLPDGYAEMLAANLALYLAPSYGRDPSPALISMARTSLSALKRAHKQTPVLRTETYTGGAYNIYSDC